MQLITYINLKLEQSDTITSLSSDFYRAADTHFKLQRIYWFDSEDVRGKEKANRWKGTGIERSHKSYAAMHIKIES